MGERGRPRTFDVNVALDQALQVFWKHGFQDASLASLEQAMNLTKPSIYAAFGDKQALYLRALQQYLARHIEPRLAILDDEAQGRAAVEKFLLSMADLMNSPLLPAGCFIINGIADVDGSATSAAVGDALLAARQACENSLRDRLERAKSDRQLPAALDSAELAAFYASIVAGIAVCSKSRPDGAKLAGVVKRAMQAWPVQSAAEPAHGL